MRLQQELDFLRIRMGYLPHIVRLLILGDNPLFFLYGDCENNTDSKFF